LPSEHEFQASGRQRMLRWLGAVLAPFLGLVLVTGAFWIYGLIAKPETTFLTSFRFALIAKQTAIVGMGALGMTAIIAAGGIDLSVGSLLALSSVALALGLESDLSPALAVIFAVSGAALCGALNGVLITSLRLVPFIVTLGTMLLFRGLAERLADQKKIQAASAPEWIATLLDPPARGSSSFVCDGVWIVLILGVLLALVLNRTVFGRRVFAVGSSEATARLCGVPVARTKIQVYALGGFFLGLAGVFQFAELNKQGDPTAGSGLELEVIAAVVIGGGSLNGGRGSVLGSLLGALLMTMLRSGCVFAEVSDPMQKMWIGMIIIGAVAVDRWRERGRHRH
jgi:ribose transport system permease protein